MAAFSYDSMVFLPNMSPINDNNFSQFYDDPSATEKQSTDNDSTVVDKLENGDDEQVTQNVTTPSTTDKKRKTMNGKSLDSMDHQGGKRRKQQKKKDEKTQEGEPPKGYIHVRARRGQATDSHSLAERVRREKISERMKILQCLVPGCDKVTGKAHMLDEIINYVQSLQNQVEFLSMKLSSINPTFYDFGVDLEALMVKPESLMNSFASPPPPPPPPQPHLPPLQQCNPTQPTTTTTASTGATFAPPHDYPLLDASASVFLHQGGRRPNVLLSSHPQDNASLLWELGCFH